MKKGKMFLKLISLVMLIVLICTLSVSATSLVVDEEVPKAQGYVYLTKAYKSQSSSYATVCLARKDPVAVTFSNSAQKTDGTMGGYYTGTVVTEVNRIYNVPYEYYLAKDSLVQARFRNHNWSLNNNRIKGVYNYL